MYQLKLALSITIIWLIFRFLCWLLRPDMGVNKAKVVPECYGNFYGLSTLCTECKSKLQCEDKTRFLRRQENGKKKQEAR
jgi:hypothetical protein